MPIVYSNINKTKDAYIYICSRRCAPGPPVCTLADRASSGIWRKWLVRWSSKERFSSEAPETHVETCAISGGCLHATTETKDFMRQGTLEICDTMSALISRCLQLFKILKNAKQHCAEYVRCNIQSLAFLGQIPTFGLFVMKTSSADRISEWPSPLI